MIIFGLCIFFVLFFLLTRQGFRPLNYILIVASQLVLLCNFLGVFRLFLAFFVLLFDWLLYPFACPKGLSLFLGVPGSGKTSLAAYLCSRYKGRVFCNVPIQGTFRINRNDIGKYDISNGMLCVDEAGIDFNNRFGTRKGSNLSIDESQTEWLKLYRHYKIDTFVCFSQRVDIDVTIRGLADRIYILKKLRIPFCVLFIGVKKILTVDKPVGSSTGQIVDAYRISPSDTHLIFTPPLWKLFDTYDAPSLPTKEFITWGNESRYHETNS